MKKSKRSTHHRMHTHNRPQNLPAGVELNPAAPPSSNNTQNLVTETAQFGEPTVTADPTQFTVKHGSDTQAYSILDSEKGTLKPQPFPIAKDEEPRMSLADAIGDGVGQKVVDSITAAKQIVFHVLGDTGNTRGPQDEDLVTDKMVSDFSEAETQDVPSFCYHLGDVVYSFGEAEYYYDQFYDPFRDYPAPIFAIPGNHDGMVSPIASATAPTLQAFLSNFCSWDKPFHRTPQAGGLSRTAGRQPSVYFTLEAPFVRIFGLYSNCLEDPGIISTQSGQKQTYPYLGDAQIKFLTAGLNRTKTEKFKGAIVIAVHHPPYVAKAESPKTPTKVGKASTVDAGKHGGSPMMLAEIDKVCTTTGVWPHAVLSGHAHNYQRFTRYFGGRETPFIVSGNGGHAHNRLTKKGMPTLRAPMTMTEGNDKIVFENYDDGDFGYLRVIVSDTQMRIEYHPASDGAEAKTPDDRVTVDLVGRKLAVSK
jgi:hypothetical protein